MKVIVASSDYEISNAITNQILGVESTSTSVIETTDDFIEALKSDEYDFIVTDYSFDGTDIWQLTKLINSKQLVGHAVPVYLISETCDTEVPVILAKEYNFQTISINDLVETLQMAHCTGYVRGQRGQVKASVLVIEDDEDASEIVYEALKSDYDVDRATDGELGLALWKKKRHDLILLDYMLPGRKGDEVLSEIMDVDKNQPIIVMTAFDKPEYNKDFILNGASQYLPKPYTLMELRAQCVSQINKAKLIYQDYYHDQKQKKLRNLVNELERELTVSNIEKARRIIDAIKINLPHSLSEDEQARTWNSVF
ncbi:response regulator [Methylomonas fluvii]|uniref:Response regulator n=1 Tax=Methylomonas fluvii TaxID=1854564 RepID=A0ABR9DL33_9GAMM|nr:response regulator [Methylomonas fluvii]MBD9363823.1 response regulator [Methylomonas fluvii]